MRILPGTRSIKEPVGPFVIGIGIFDGVHLGHRALLGRVRDLANSHGIDSLVYTFDPHPARVLVPDKAPQLIEPIEHRLAMFASLGINATLIERFDQEFATITAEEFAKEVLGHKLMAREVVVGGGFTFGANARGNVELLRASGSEVGYGVHEVAPIEHEGKVISSTRIRILVREGEMQQVAKLLGRPFNLSGVVVRGVMRGQKLGFPTANLQARNEVVPARGVYAARASTDFGSWGAVVNIGYTPTFGSESLKVEAHLLDYSRGALYGQMVDLQLLERLREEQRFGGPEELKTQIKQDIDKAREVLVESKHGD